MKNKNLHNITIGEILLEDYLKPMGISQYALAKAIHVPQTRISEIIRGKRRLTPDTALRFGTFFQTSPDFWLGMQTECELRAARRKIEARVLKQIRPFTELSSQ
jgi:addiction module HigA family antidote